MAKELLFKVTKKDLEITHFRAGGNGGQNQNKRDSATRIKHPASGAVAESREHRTQGQNNKAAFLRLVETPKYKAWLRKRIAEEMMSLQDRERRKAAILADVERSMSEDNIVTQVQDEHGHWVDISLGTLD